MAAGAGAASGGSMEATLSRKLQAVSNTMDSIQGLSTWCIDNKKYHSVIVRHWIKCLRKSDALHRLNLFYVANDVIQNCKRKNAIVYRTEFAEVLPEAFLLVNHDGNTKVIKSVERILSIWEERGVYTAPLITELRGNLVKEESPPETPVEQKTPVESKADLRSKVVAEFVPQALVDQLSKYKRSLEEVDMREKQLAAMRVDICSSTALKKLKDKAGGKRFSKDFEEGNTQLQEFVKFFDKESKVGRPLMEALSNADIFYEMQYKEVKIVANAYQTFANRVSHLKRKLDSLKATLPDLDESPLPSPSADAPSPTGSESPFHGMDMADAYPDLDGSAVDEEAEAPAPSPLSSLGGASPVPSPAPSEMLGETDNRQVEDMDLSEEENDSGGIIVEQQTEQVAHRKASASAPVKKEIPVKEKPVGQATPPPAAAPAPAATPAATPAAAPSPAMESVDLGKITSILSSLSSVLKSAAPLLDSPPAAAAPTAPLNPLASSQEASSSSSSSSSSLASLLSKADVTPTELLGALSKAQSQSGFGDHSSNRSSPAPTVSPASSTTGKTPPASASSCSSAAAASQSGSVPSAAPVPSTAHAKPQDPQAPTRTSNRASALVRALHRDMDLSAEQSAAASQSLESKIHSFLQGNPAFSAFDLGFPANPAGGGGGNVSPGAGADNQGGTPVRDEGGGTPTQDEIMDKPAAAPLAPNQPSVRELMKTGPVTFKNTIRINLKCTQASLQPDPAQNGQAYQAPPAGANDTSEHGMAAPAAQFQQFPPQTGGPAPADRAPGGAAGSQAAEGFPGMNDRGWYSDSFSEVRPHPPRGFGAAPSGENPMPGLYAYQTEPSREELAPPPSLPSGFLRGNFPPVPKLPPPPRVFDTPLPAAGGGGAMMAPDQQAPGVMAGAVVHDHQHKSAFRSDELPPIPAPPPPRHLENSQQDAGLYQDGAEPYPPDQEHFEDAPYFQDGAYPLQDDPYYEPLPFPRGRGANLPPSEDAYYNYHAPPRPHFAPRRHPPPPPPHHAPRHPLGPPHPGFHPHPRGPPRGPPFPQFHGPSPGFRGKRPGPRGGGGGGGIPGPMFPPKRPFPPPRY